MSAAPRRAADWGGRWLAEFETRLRSTDVVQAAVAYLTVLGFVLLTRWPAGASVDNALWYPLVQTRAVLGALLGLGYGAAEARAVPRRRAATLAALALLTLVGLPLDAVAHAATLPATPLAWSFATPVASVASFFAIGLGLGALAARLRLGALLPLLVPGVLALAVIADLRLGLVVFNPITAATVVAPLHGALLLLGTLAALAATFGASLRVARRGARAAGESADGSAA